MSYNEKDPNQPGQTQELPGLQHQMKPVPESIRDNYIPASKLKGKKALITGGDSGIGRAVAVHFAAEGADVHFGYLSETTDAMETIEMAQSYGTKCSASPGDLGNLSDAETLVKSALRELGSLDILVLNAAEQHPEDRVDDIDPETLDRTFRTNVYGHFHVLKFAMEHLPANGVIILTSSVTAFRGSSHLIDYSATKGAVTAMTRSLAANLGERGIRVNSVAPRPVWTPLIPATFEKDKVEKFGEQSIFERPAQPSEVAPAYVFLASEDASYITGHTLHVNGGDFIDN